MSEQIESQALTHVWEYSEHKSIYTKLAHAGWHEPELKSLLTQISETILSDVLTPKTKIKFIHLEQDLYEILNATENSLKCK